MSDKSRILWIDIAKGICMISVIAGHLDAAEINNIVFSFHLTLFFILSGYTLKTDLSVKSASKRFARLMTPYFVTCAMIVLMDIFNLIVDQKVTDTISITAKISSDIARGFFGSGLYTSLGTKSFSSCIGAIWFLPAMFFATVIAQLVISRITDIKKRYAITVTAAVLAFISSQLFWLPFSIQSAVFAVPFIMLGYDAKAHGIFDRIKLSHFFISLGVFLIGFCLKLTTISFVTASMSDIIVTPIFALCACVCIVYISQKCTFLSPLAFVGRYSMYYLCSHLFELETMWLWQKRFLLLLGIPYNKATLFVLRVIFDTAVVFLILGLKRLFAKVKTADAVLQKRDLSIDIARAVLIFTMIAGHFILDSSLRAVIYSFHMPAFILFSGYLFKRESCENLKKSVLKAVKSLLIPYAAFCVMYILINNHGFLNEIKTLVLGMSFSKKLFTDISSVGPCYFLLLLFAVRVLYLIIARIFKDNDIYTTAAVTVLSFAGLLLGKGGLWLPWSFDVALYSLIFYHIGYLIKKHGILDYISQRPYYYFIIACVWAYSVYSGGLELATRSYGSYGIAVIGAVCGTVIVYMLSRYICTHFSKAVTKVLCAIGENTLYILIIHTLFTDSINNAVEKFLELTPSYIYHITVAVFVNLALGVALGYLIKAVKKLFLMKNN